MYSFYTMKCYRQAQKMQSLGSGEQTQRGQTNLGTGYEKLFIC